MKQEIGRFVRYFGTLAASIAVVKFGLPTELQGPTADVLTLALGQAVAYAWSLKRDKKKAR